MTFKPMLASPAPEDLGALRFPVLASPKYDGIRVVVYEGRLITRKLKLVANRALRSRYEQLTFEGLDGELIAGDPCAPDVFQRTTSAVMSRESADADNVIFYAFDRYVPGHFSRRRDRIPPHKHVECVDQQLIGDVHELLEYEAAVLTRGYEGVMLRAPDGPYKHGRSTTREGYLLKLKRFAHDEAEVLSAFEQLHNGNEATTDALGRTKRSTHKANRTGKGTLGGYRVRMLGGPFKGAVVDVGTGWTDAERAALWASGPPPGTLMRVKYQLAGSKDAPRFPVFAGWRDKRDM